MGEYFKDSDSMFTQVGGQVEKTLDGIMRRYRKLHPPGPPTYRAYQQRGIMRGPDYRYQADFNQEFPAAARGSYVYAWARIWADTDSEIKFDLTCYSPVVLWCNRRCLFQSTIIEERDPTARHSLRIPLRTGWNHLVLRFKKTRAGFGGKFGPWLGKLAYYFLMPTAERAGQEGWLFSEPLAAELRKIPGAGVTEKASGIRWLPRMEWAKDERKSGQCRRIFGAVPGACAVGWTSGMFPGAGTGQYTLSGHCLAPITVTIAGRQVFSTRRAGPFRAVVTVPAGRQDVMVLAESTGGDWGYELTLRHGAKPVALASPCNLQGRPETWIYLGPLRADSRPDPARLRNLHQVVPGVAGDTYWRLDAPDFWVRIYNDHPLFGHWNYPLGVTIYGLLHSARALGAEEMQAYLRDHVQFSCDVFHYAQWDKRQFGGAVNVHHLLTSIDSLDDCGSFGSCLLEMGKYFRLAGLREIADYVAAYISERQIRLPDGTFFRKHLMHAFHEDTLWADDLYMSVPFLCRYYELTGEQRYVDDAARQFLGFKRLLFIPELKLMSHVYDFKRQLATGVPWGRGNGWVIFSLSELLAVLPARHALRPELLAMFRELCAGYLARQDARGMWHQVLNEPDSYPETSCTSMFTYAFARGVQYGWLEDPAPYSRAVFKAWAALNRVSIDRHGNIHGVCRGSEFSYDSEYYKKDLLSRLNDTHGIGIVLLAGVEVIRLAKHLQKSAPARPAAARRARATPTAAGK